MDQPWSGRKLHFVGIGGAGMSGLAVVAHALGASISGSDRAPSWPDWAYQATGYTPQVGHDKNNVPPGATVVYSSAIPPENPERTTGAPELHRADLLGEVTTLKPTIAVSGTHGKTTTTSMIVHALGAQSYLVGGVVRSTGANAGWGDDEWLVVEADESDRSLLKLHPTIAVVTNAELDHHTTYTDQRDVEETFEAFLALADRQVVPPDLVRLAPHAATFKTGEIPVTLTVPGEHNAQNAAAALKAIELAGQDVTRAAAKLTSFEGAGRRFERLGVTEQGAEVVDDYAHHPTEVSATIAAARTLEPKRLVALFQPHLYSRTQHLAKDFGRALSAADLAVVLAIYPARENQSDYPGVTSELITDAVTAPVTSAEDLKSAEAFLRTHLRAGDLLLTMGAGDVDTVGKVLVGESRSTT
jgi:UDP-N-acetylmuramate--alanine ligase